MFKLPSYFPGSLHFLRIKKKKYTYNIHVHFFHFSNRKNISTLLEDIFYTVLTIFSVN